MLSEVTHLHDVVGAVLRLLAGETLISLDEVVELLRLAGRDRERELEDRRLIQTLTGVSAKSSSSLPTASMDQR